MNWEEFKQMIKDCRDTQKLFEKKYGIEGLVGPVLSWDWNNIY